MENGRISGGSPFAKAYAHLRGALLAGQYPTGSRLKVGDIARELLLSPTPVREALATLSGEAIVRRHRDAGYFVPRLDAQEVADLYALEARCLASRAVSRRLPLHAYEAGLTDVAMRSVDDIRALTEWLAICSNNRELLATVHLLNDRLSAARRAEATLWSIEELEAVWTTSARGEAAALRAIRLHLQRCIHHAREIAALASRDKIE